MIPEEIFTQTLGRRQGPEPGSSRASAPGYPAGSALRKREGSSRSVPHPGAGGGIAGASRTTANGAARVVIAKNTAAAVYPRENSPIGSGSTQRSAAGTARQRRRRRLLRKSGRLYG